MSYYRYITGVYKSYLPELNRTLRSSSVPRHIPEHVESRSMRCSSVPSSEIFSDFYSATPFLDRARSLPREIDTYHHTRCTPTTTTTTTAEYSNFDYKVLDYMSRLNKEDTTKTTIHQSRQQRTASPSFSSLYNYYDSNKHSAGYLYPPLNDVLSSWKHFNLSSDTLNYRNNRAKSPMVTRELNRYYEKHSNYVGDPSRAGADFRHYNYRRVPYFGGSDEYQFMKTNPFRGNRGF